MALDFAAFSLSYQRHGKADAKDMSRQIELIIGKDLQFIRVNGTLGGWDNWPDPVFTLATARRACTLLRFGWCNDVARRLKAIEDQVHQKHHRQRRHQKKVTEVMR